MIPEVVSSFVTDVKLNFPSISGKIETYVQELSNDGVRYQEAAEHIFGLIDGIAKRRGWGRQDVLDFYADFVIEYLREQERFVTTGVFSNEGRSFEEIRADVYDDEEHMLSYMVGLFISYVIFPHHYAQYRFYLDRFLPLIPSDGQCVEFGCGHGFFMLETLRLGPKRHVDGYDVSAAALKLAEDLFAVAGVSGDQASLSLDDVVTKALPQPAYHGMTAAGLLEHIADPVGFLRQVRERLDVNGHIFVMLPVNIAHADHMILFDEPEDCQKLMRDGGYRMVAERIIPTENLPPEELKARKIPIVYLGIYGRN